MFEQRMTLLTLGVADVGRARTFYERLGWKASGASQEEIAFFQIGPAILALYGQENLSNDTGLSSPRPGGMTLAHNVRSREEVSARLSEAVAAGATVVREPHDTDYGGHVAYFADPDGHPWEIAFVEMFLPDAQGSVSLPA